MMGAIDEKQRHKNLNTRGWGVYDDSENSYTKRALFLFLEDHIKVYQYEFNEEQFQS